MKAYFVMFVSDGRFPEQSAYPKGYSSHVDEAFPYSSAAEAEQEKDSDFSPTHPWYGCYHVIETQWNEETGEIS